MINTIKNIAIFKKDNKGNDKLPSYTLTAKVNEEFVEIGAGWVKDYTKGKYISCQLSKAWVDSKDNTKSRKSFVIVSEEDLNKLIELAQINDNRIIDPADGRDLTPISADEIPF